jgi:MFS family permease
MTGTPLSAGSAWALVGLMWVAYFLNYADRQLVSSIFPVLKAELHFSDEQCGLTISVFLWIYAVCSPLAGMLGDRFPRRTLIVASLVLWSAFTALTGASGSALALLTCRGLMGISESIFFPSAVTLTAEVHGPASRSRAVAFFSTGQLAGVVMGGWYGGFMADHHHWREAFFSLGVFGALYALPYYFFLKRSAGPSSAPSGTPSTSITTIAAAAALFRIPTYRLLCVVFPAFTFVLWLLYTWLTNFVYEKFSLSLGQAGFVSTVYLQGATLGGLILGGILADRLYGRFKAARFWIVAAGLLICGPGVQFIGTSGSLLPTKIAMAGFGLGSGLAMSNFFASCFEVVPSGARATAVGILNLLGGFISGFAALLGGLLKRSVGIHTLTSGAALLCLAVGLLLILGTRRTFPGDYARALGAEAPS